MRVSRSASHQPGGVEVRFDSGLSDLSADASVRVPAGRRSTFRFVGSQD
jgi:hypothetical protein